MKKFDALMKKVELFERLAVYGDRKSFLQVLAQEIQTFPNPSDSGINAPYVPGTAPASSPAVSSQPVSTTPSAPAPAPKVPARPHAQYNPRVKAVQVFINKELVPAGFISPIDQDGKYGTETDNALKEWGRVNKLNLSAPQLFQVAEAKAAGSGIIQELQNTPNLNAQKA